MHPFANSADLILIIFILAGLAGTFVPILPGPTLIATGALIHSLIQGFAPIGWPQLFGLIVACLVAALGQTMLSSYGTHKFGGSKYGMIGGAVGFFAGIFLPFPGGMLVGAFAGAIGCELYFAKQEFRLAAKAGFGGVLGLLASFLFEILITFAMAIYVVVLFYR